MSTFFKAEDTVVIKGRGLVLFGTIVEGIVKVGMFLNIESFPRQLIIDGLEWPISSPRIPGLIGLLFLSTDQQEIDLWKSIDIKDKVFEVHALSNNLNK